MLSQKKLNTYGVESPCERLPGVGSFLANPGLSKEQHLRRCTMRAFKLPNTSIKIMAQYLRRCIVTTFTMEKYIHWNASITPMALHITTFIAADG